MALISTTILLLSLGASAAEKKALVGGRLIDGGMFMLPEDFDRFGSQVYRGQWATVFDESQVL